MTDLSLTPKPQEGSWLWLYKIIAGLLIVLLLGLHFIVNHLIAPSGLLTYEEVVRYYQNPIIPIIEIAFLVFVVSHALVGLRSILLDLNPSNQMLKVVDIVFWLAGSAFIIYGIWLVWVIAQRGAGS